MALIGSVAHNMADFKATLITDIYGGNAGSGTAIATIEMGSITIPTAFPFECDFTNGLTIVTTSTSNITVIYE